MKPKEGEGNYTLFKYYSPFINFMYQIQGQWRPETAKATSQSTIFDIPMRPLREDQKQRHRFTAPQFL